jgi:hypothetical protein
MKSLLLLLMFSGTAAALQPLRPVSECLDPDRARGWHLVDSDEILVDAGRKRFHLQLSPSCPELAFTDTVGFRSGDGIGRICGSAGDTVVAARHSPIGLPCRIVKVTPLTREQYAAKLEGDDLPTGKVEVREEAAPHR